VTGVLHTLVGRQEVSAIKRTFRFDWTYSGVELRLVGFGAVVPPGDTTKSAGPTPTETTDALQ
jgi:conjugal transfer pilus assembly protein TraE